MKISYLDYYKLLLEKVSFDTYLLSKEYRKAARDLSENEKEELTKWLKEVGLAPLMALEDRE